MTPLFTALRFLTVIPISWRADQDGDLFKQSIYYFSLIGLLIGCGGWLLVSILGTFLPVSSVAFLAVLYLSSVSGFLHLDGLADSGDGLLSYRPKDDSLRIMKDSRTGAMGVVVLIMVLLGKYSALSSLSMPSMALTAFFMPLAGRSAILVTMATNKYARPEGGLGGLFYSSRSQKAALGGILLLFVVGGTVLGGKVALVLAASMLSTVFVFSWFCRMRIGGVTGDTLGAMCEITELAVALSMTAMFSAVG